MKPKTDTKTHHKIPRRVILNNFASRITKKTNNPDQYYIWAFNKNTGKVFEPNILEACAENKFYQPSLDADLAKVLFNVELENEEKIVIKGYEEALSYVEAKTSPIITQILREKTIANLTLEEKQQLSFFIACQYVRTDAFRQNQQIIANSEKTLFEKSAAHIKTSLSDNEQYQTLKAFTESGDGKTIYHTASLDPKVLYAYSAMIMDKDLVLFETDKSNPFIVGDSPVVLHNDNKTGFYGNLGFGVTGIQIYMPISSTMTLGFLCNSVIQNRKKLYEDAVKKVQIDINHTKSLLVMGRLNSAQREFLKNNLVSHENNLTLLDQDKFITDAMEQKKVVAVDPERLKFLNQRQAIFAEKFVYSNKNDFSLVKELIEINPFHRKGWNIKTNLPNQDDDEEK